MSRTYETNLSKVVIDGDIVRKTITIEDDSICESQAPYLVSELCILNLLNGADGFPRLLDFVIDSPNYSIVMSNVGRRIRKCDDPIKQLIEILKLVATLHVNHIVHSDLKLDNIMEDDNGKISLIDFTHSYLSCPTNNGKPEMIRDINICATYDILAPETYDRRIIKTSAIDIWSLGCVFYSLITGRGLFIDYVIPDEQATGKGVGSDHTQEIVQRLHKDMKFIWERINDTISNAYHRDLLQRMLAPVAKRPTAVQLLADLGVSFNPPILFESKTYSGSGYGCVGPLRSFYEPGYACEFNDRLVNHLTPLLTLTKTYVWGRQLQYDRQVPQNTYDRYTIYSMCGIIVNALAVDKESANPWDILCCGNEYMTLLKDIIDCCWLAVMFS